MKQCDGSGKIIHQCPEYGEFVDEPGSRIPVGMMTWEDDCPGCPKCRPCVECGGLMRVYDLEPHGMYHDIDKLIPCPRCQGTGVEK